VTFGSLFAGIGGFDFGLERAGLTCKWQVEIDPFCRAVLEKHWPHVKRYDDVRTIHGEAAHMGDSAQLLVQRQPSARIDHIGHSSSRPVSGQGAVSRDCGACLEPVDLVCGGFPCQPHSLAGRRKGSQDERDLWPEFARIIRELRPRWVLAENVPGLLSIDAGRFFGGILRDLAACGYDAEWDCLPASAFGAPHRRDRIWLVAYAECGELRDESRRRGRPCGSDTAITRDHGAAEPMAYSHQSRLQGWLSPSVRERPNERVTGSGDTSVADADGSNGHGRRGDVQVGRIWGTGEAPRYDDIAGAQWRVESDVGRVAHGVPARVDRLRSLGNAIVPQIAEWIGRQILIADRYPDR
jgi:DNA (cytosine-5)-methyltransferase 1